MGDKSNPDLPFNSVKTLMKRAADGMQVSKSSVELMIEILSDYLKERTYKAREIALVGNKRRITKRCLELS